MPLSLYVVPTICEPLVGQPVSACIEHHPHLVGLELADCSASDSALPVDVLIGSDYYWALVTGSVCRGSSEWPYCCTHKTWLGVVWSVVHV